MDYVALADLFGKTSRYLAMSQFVALLVIGAIFSSVRDFTDIAKGALWTLLAIIAFLSLAHIPLMYYYGYYSGLVAR